MKSQGLRDGCNKGIGENVEAQKLVHTIALISHTMSTDNTALGGWTIHEQKTINLQTNSDDSVSLEEYKLGTNVCMHIT